MKSPYGPDLGQSTPSDFACRRNRATLPSSGGGMVRRMPTPGVQHHPRRDHPRKQRELGVPVLGPDRRPEPELEAAVLVEGHLLLGKGQAGATARGFEVDSLLADLLEQQQVLVGGPAVDGLLDADVVEPLPAADPGAIHRGLGHLAAGVEPHVPDERRPQLVRQQAAGVLADHRRVQRRALVRRVHRLDATMGLGVEDTARGDVRGHVGNRIPHPVPLPRPLKVQRLVEVHRPHRVDGHERNIGLVTVRHDHVLRRRAPPPRATSGGNSSGTFSSTRIAANRASSAFWSTSVCVGTGVVVRKRISRCGMAATIGPTPGIPSQHTVPPTRHGRRDGHTARPGHNA